MAASQDRRFYLVREYWFYLGLLTFGAFSAVARIAGIVGTWWWSIAPVAVVVLVYLGTYVVLRFEYKRRSGRASGP
ncbi:Flp pilus assembly protein TadB [Nocardioides ginsengisegetis]|uniref:Flp pilus assembly protein TadB n=1 Tax=Nocardioides ginsengisegetis TaxID=661491 RepID=A0A7W3J3G6_9ACTN|nr:Flp pilus assembly protein TadB [Nocardioides ginsengisegetis]